MALAVVCLIYAPTQLLFHPVASWRLIWRYMLALYILCVSIFPGELLLFCCFNKTASREDFCFMHLKIGYIFIRALGGCWLAKRLVFIYRLMLLVYNYIFHYPFTRVAQIMYNIIIRFMQLNLCHIVYFC